jgi:GNAT superfamily N-acetyltransferase
MWIVHNAGGGRETSVLPLTREDEGVTVVITEVALDDPRAQDLRDELDEELDRRYASISRDEPPELTAARDAALEIHAEQVVATWIAVDADGTPLGHVMLRRLGDEWELKRLIVPERARRRGVGGALTRAVIDRARAGGAQRVILQSGPAQPESIALYTAAGFRPIPVYEPYRETMPNSLCFELRLDEIPRAEWRKRLTPRTAQS